MLTIKELKVPGYKRVIEANESQTGLHCFVAIHNSTLGPALGGTRIFPYAHKDEALQDVLRLAEAMTYKSAIAESGTGGGKSVIIADPRKTKTPELLRAFGQVVNALEGEYIAAEDVGSNVEDMLSIHETSPYVSALPLDTSSGDPSRFTAWGVFKGIQATAMKLWGSSSLKGKTILIQGLGNVGSKLASLIFWEGGHLVLTDIDALHLEYQTKLYGAQAVSPKEFLKTKCDILAPCALGNVITREVIPSLRCQAIAGAANNQLEEANIGELLMRANILYAPDFVINAGGLINAASEFDHRGYDPKFVRDKVNHIYEILLNLMYQAEKNGKATNKIAMEIAQHNLTELVGQRKEKIQFKPVGSQKKRPKADRV